MILDHDNCLLYIEPKKSKDVTGNYDELSMFMREKVYNVEEDQKNAFAKKTAPKIKFGTVNPDGSVQEGVRTRGAHTCVCGVASANFDFEICNGVYTNTLAGHYLIWHRSEVSRDELEKAKMVMMLCSQEDACAKKKKSEPTPVAKSPEPVIDMSNNMSPAQFPIASQFPVAEVTLAGTLAVHQSNATGNSPPIMQLPAPAPAPAPAPETPPVENKTPVKSRILVIKAIKNNLCKGLAIGESVTIAGLVKDTETDEGTFGAFTRFLGDFKCKVNSGENESTIYIAPKMHLPEVAEGQILLGYNAAREKFLAAHQNLIVQDEDSEDVAAVKRKSFAKQFPGAEFAFFLEKTPDTDPRNARGYQWACKPLLEMEIPADKFLKMLN